MKYKNPNLSTNTRVRDLLSRMNLEEKVGQMVSTTPVSQVKGDKYTDAICLRQSKRLIDRGVGQLGVAVRHTNAGAGARMTNRLQKYALEKTRLGIPVMIQDECVHGCKASGSTMFPMSIGLAASWNTELMERIVHAIGAETRSRGIRQCFSPTLNIARDVRCGRVEETYGEDAYLVSRMGVAFIKTLQEHGIAATPKHFVANFVGDGGRDSHPIHFSERILREVYFPAFRAAVEEAGTMSMMIAHTAIDGIPCSVNKWLMDDIFRKEWGFEGFIVPDNTDVQKNYAIHSQSDSYEQSAMYCVTAGLDTDLSWTPPPANLCYERSLPKLVKEGVISEKLIDKSVSRILKIKFELGLFDNPWQDEKEAAALEQCVPHRELAREASRQAMVLLKNRKKLLPLSKDLKNIAVMGPSAKVIRLGGYTCDEPNTVTPIEGIQVKLGKGTKLSYVEGCKLTGNSRRGFAKALEVAKKADAVILCMGNSSDKIIGQPETTEGERHDRCNLDLPGVQQDFIQEIAKVNPNTVIVLQNGSAITMESWLKEVGAILETWYPGAEGGNAIADVVFGDYNPGGRLPITFPVHSGQLPLYYNPRPHGRVEGYCDLRGEQHQFPFGYGLSYTKFVYSDMKIETIGKGKRLKAKVSCTLRNSGKMAGDEVVQLYLRDCYSRITRPIIELHRFQRVSLEPKESKVVEFTLNWNDFAYLDEKMKPILEPGEFRIMLAASSKDIRLEERITL